MQIAMLGRRWRSVSAHGAGSGVDAGGECREDRVESTNRLRVTADHEAEPSFESEHATAGANVDIVNALRLEGEGPVDVVLVEGVAAVDHDVARLHEASHVHDRLPGERGGHHHRYGPRRLELGDEIVQRCRCQRSVVCEVLHRVIVDVVDDALVSGPHQASHQARAHAPQPDHS